MMHLHEAMKLYSLRAETAVIGDVHRQNGGALQGDETHYLVSESTREWQEVNSGRARRFRF